MFINKTKTFQNDTPSPSDMRFTIVVISIYIVCFITLILLSLIDWIWLFFGAGLSFFWGLGGWLSLIKYLRTIQRMRHNKITIPKTYIIMIPLSLLAISSTLWSYTLVSQVSVSSKMNTIEEFTKSAKACKVESITSTTNGLYHRAADADAYISVVTSDNLLYYSQSQKDALHKILFDSSAKCPKYSQALTSGRPVWDADRVGQETY